MKDRDSNPYNPLLQYLNEVEKQFNHYETVSTPEDIKEEVHNVRVALEILIEKVAEGLFDPYPAKRAFPNKPL